LDRDRKALDDLILDSDDEDVDDRTGPLTKNEVPV
jgi:hypothetical protein